MELEECGVERGASARATVKFILGMWRLGLAARAILMFASRFATSPRAGPRLSITT